MANRKSICNLIGVDETFQLFFGQCPNRIRSLGTTNGRTGDEQAVVVVGDYHNDDDDDGQGTDGRDIQWRYCFPVFVHANSHCKLINVTS